MKDQERLGLTELSAVEHLLSADEIAARDSVRRFIDDRFRPLLNDAHREARFPRQLIPELADLGVFGIHLEGYGGSGMSNVAYGLVMQELERADSSLRSVCSVQTSLVIHPILAFGSEEQRQRWLPKLVSGESLGCFGLTEPTAGSDPSSIKTTAVRDGDHYVLDGVKSWITNAPLADLAVVWAKVEDEDQRIRGFVVERGTPGFVTSDIPGKLSLRISPTGEIQLNQCRVPAENLLAKTGGLGSALKCLTEARFGIAWGVTGAAMDCFDTVLEYGIDRAQFGKPLAAFQLYQDQLAEMATQIVQSQLVNLHYGRIKDDGQLSHVHVNLMKRANVRSAREIARTCRAMMGANGIVDAYPIMRHVMNLESVYTYEGTHEMHTLAMGRALTGMSAFS